jgi:hypothetical protein
MKSRPYRRIKSNFIKEFGNYDSREGKIVDQNRKGFYRAERKESMMETQAPTNWITQSEQDSTPNPAMSFGLDQVIADGHGNSRMSEQNQRRTREAIRPLSQRLAAMHDLQPLDRKKGKRFEYQGRGGLSISDILNQTLIQGAFSLQERRRVRVNKQKPKVALLFDISSSMYNTKVHVYAQILALIFIEIFGQDFAREFYFAPIGDPFNALANGKYPDVKDFILNVDFESGTPFRPAIEFLRNRGFYNGSDLKFVFLLTDGRPEITDWSGNTDVIRSAEEANLVIKTMKNEWVKSNNIEYFWIQFAPLEYVPANRSCRHIPNLQTLFEKYRGTWLEEFYIFLLQEEKKKNILYLLPNQLQDGSGFHLIMEYFRIKFSRYFQ